MIENRLKSGTIFIAFIFSFFPQIPVFAQDPDEKRLAGMSLSDLLQTQVEIGTSTAVTIFRTPSTVSVIDADLIKKYGFTSLADVLSTVAGFAVLRTTGRQQIPTARSILQDHYPNKVLFLINGIPNWNPTTNEMGSLNRISLSSVERIEVLKGPASVIYGTNAYAGAVNVILKHATVPNTTLAQASMLVGEKAGIGLSGGVLASGEDWRFHASASNYGEKGILREIIGSDGIKGSYADFISYRNITAEVGYGMHSFLVNMYVEDQQKFGVAPTFSGGIGEPQNMSGILAGYGNEFPVNKDFTMRSGFQIDWQNRILPRDSAGTIFTDVTGWRLSGNVLGIYALSPFIRIEGGIDYDHRVSVSYTNYNAISRQTFSDANMNGRTIAEASAFVQLGYETGGFNILAGTRYTNNQFFGDNVSSRISAVYMIDQSNSVKIIAGQSFRAPSTFEVFVVNANRTLGGLTSLLPERSESIELAFLTSIGNVFVQTQVYTSSYMDKIFRVTRPSAMFPDGSPGTVDAKQYTNGSSLSSQGLEVEARYRWSGLDAFVTYTYVTGDRGDTVGTGDPTVYNFKYVPQHTIVAGSAVKIGSAFVSGVVRRVSSTLGGRSSTIPSQMRVDLNVGFEHPINRWTARHQLSLRNMFNSEMLFAEYVERGINSIPGDLGRRISYCMSIDF